MEHRAEAPIRRTKVLPPTYVALAITVMAVLDALAPWRRVIPFPWSVLGVVALGAGIVLELVADSDLKKHATTVKPFEQSSSLVTTGAYGICRHPMYLGFVLILLGLAVIMGAVTPFLVIPAFVALVETAFIRIEEQMMEAQFGDAWRAYRARVGRWL